MKTARHVMSNEERFYEPLRKWLSDELGFYTGGGVVYLSGSKKAEERVFVRTGIRDLQADVVGIKYAGNDVFSDIEICVIEVKDAPKVTRQHIHQAYGYTKVAHTVYLSAPAPIDDDMRQILRDFGVGYIRIKEGGRSFEIMQTSNKFVPSEKEMLRLLDSLWIGKCCLCQCFFPKWERWTDNGEERGKTYKIMKRPKIPGEANELDYSRKSSGKSVVKKYICYYCLRELQAMRE
jgi:hypothetical protein